MRFLKHIRSKSKVGGGSTAEAHAYEKSTFSPERRGGGRGHNGVDVTARLPSGVWYRIFSYVCPHSEDESYESAEDSMVEDGCMLCDMRDLASCALVCRRWNNVARRMLYHSVRIDAVHYCEREEQLAEKRKHRSFFERNGDPRDAPRQRLLLFGRTVREQEDLSVLVRCLKVAYMTREGYKADLARTVSVLANLQYVDLPEGFFADDPSCTLLKQELQARCPDIRKMKYTAGSEASFALLATRRHWQALQILELSQLDVEPTMLLRVLGRLPTLHELRIGQLSWLDDTIFQPVPSLPPFPPLQKLLLDGTPNLTAAGLVTYLSRPDTAEVLSSLTLVQTGIAPSSLHLILARAHHLTHLSITETVSRSFPVEHVPLLQSRSLVALHYEITSASTAAHSLQQPSVSYYNYLAESLHANGLPGLGALYVRDPDFPETLILTPPQPAFAAGGGGGSARGNNKAAHQSPPPAGFRQQLNVYSKGLDELEWNFTSVSPPSAPGRRGSFTPQRPISMVKLLDPTSAATAAATGGGGGGDRLSLPPGWAFGGDAPRRSVLVGNGFGGFLAVPAPDEDVRPGSSSGWAGGGGSSVSGSASVGTGGAGVGGGGVSAGNRGSRHDLWR